MSRPFVIATCDAAAEVLKEAGTSDHVVAVTDRLHEGRTADVPCHQIVTTVSAWLAELGAHSPLVEDLASSIDVGDWPTACAIGEYLSVDVTVAYGTARGAFNQPF